MTARAIALAPARDCGQGARVTTEPSIHPAPTTLAPTTPAPTTPALRWQCVCFDSTDPRRIGSFWEQALGWRRTYDADDEVVLEPPEGSREDGVSPDILFLRVPEQKSTKNRLHIDLRPTDQGAEVARLETLGAVRADVGQGDDQTWVVLADPDGNEFCVLRAFTDDELADG